MKETAKVFILKDSVEQSEPDYKVDSMLNIRKHISEVSRSKIEQAFEVLKRTSRAMPKASTDELRILVNQSNAATAVCKAYFEVFDILSLWTTGLHKKAEIDMHSPRFTNAWTEFQNAIDALEIYLKNFPKP
jgi:hypothetical protein